MAVSGHKNPISRKFSHKLFKTCSKKIYIFSGQNLVPMNKSICLQDKCLDKILRSSIYPAFFYWICWLNNRNSGTFRTSHCLLRSWFYSRQQRKCAFVQEQTEYFGLANFSQGLTHSQSGELVFCATRYSVTVYATGCRVQTCYINLWFLIQYLHKRLIFPPVLPPFLQTVKPLMITISYFPSWNFCITLIACLL